MRSTEFLTVFACLAALATSAAAAPRHVIVIAMENKDGERAGGKSRGYIYGNTEDAPYLNGALAAEGARATNFTDELTAYNSQPHYIAMEAGTNRFADTTFTCDNDPAKPCSYLYSQPNWTKSTEHLTAQMEAAHPPVSWMTYQEDIDPKTTGACPVHSAGLYAAKHNPFVYFADAAGAPPARDNARCIAHTRSLAQFMPDLAAGRLASYVFVTPNLCHDMHGARGCRDNTVAEGDDFLKEFLPPVIGWARQNDAVVFLVWDEGKKGLKLPFYAVGSGVKSGYQGKLPYSHRSLVKTVERIFGLPELEPVKSANDLSDLFEPGTLP
jgi:phosphatidylinositol-3-phosphatase